MKEQTRFDMKVRLKKIGQLNSSPHHMIRINQTFTGILDQSCLDENGFPIKGEMIIIKNVFRTSQLNYFERIADNLFILTTANSRYEMLVLKSTRIKRRL